METYKLLLEYPETALFVNKNKIIVKARHSCFKNEKVIIITGNSATSYKMESISKEDFNKNYKSAYKIK